MHEMVEPLEGRLLFKSFLQTPVEGTLYAIHIHPVLVIDIEGEPRTVPSNIGITAAGPLPLHTHDDSGVIHVESPKPKTFKLKDFFKVWGQKLSKKQVLDHKLSKTEQVTILVNGVASKGIGTQVLHDQDVVIIKVEPKPAKVR